MQPDPFAPQQQTVIVGQTSAVPVAQMDPYGNPVVYLPQERSSGAKVLGILCIITGGLSILAALGAFVPMNDVDGNVLDVPIIARLLGALAYSLCGGAFVVGGWWLLEYKRRGIHLCWLGLVCITVLYLASMAAGLPVPADDFTSDAYQFATTSDIVFGTIGCSICSAICGLIVAIPMMSATGGLDDSSLF